MPDITTEDRFAIYKTIALHGHLVDDREWDRLGEVFALTEYGYERREPQGWHIGHRKAVACPGSYIE
ncbi:hypothetical protein AB0M34_12550 [Nocardia sp. NPDC050193]